MKKYHTLSYVLSRASSMIGHKETVNIKSVGQGLTITST